MKVEEVLVYWKCDECDNRYETEGAAELCAQGDRRKAKARIKQLKYADSVRMEAGTIQEIPSLIIQYAKEYMKLDVEFKEFPTKFSMVSTSHGAPFGKSMGFNQDKLPGIQGMCVASVSGQQKDTDLRTLFDRPWSGDYDPGFNFRGFHLGNGSSHGYVLYFFLADFPHLWVKYQRYEALNMEWQDYESRVESAGDLAREWQTEFLNEDEQYQSVQDQIIDLENKLRTLRELQQETEEREYVRIYAGLEPKCQYDVEEFARLRADLGMFIKQS